MKNHGCWFRRMFLVLALGGMVLSVGAVDSLQVKKLFAKPTRDYASAPLWVWNDMLTEDQIRDTMRDLAKQEVKQVFVHPRPGLMTPYLSEDWWRLWRVAMKEAKKLDMNVWIYDENSYPSGFAGGWVPELMPESRGRGLQLKEAKTLPKWTDNLLGVYRIQGEKVEEVTAKAKAGESLPEGQFVVASLLRAANSPWHGNRSYVDLLYPGVTEKFLEVTLEPYRREFGKEFGKRIPGSFTDEPNIRPAGGLPWTDDLAKEFQKRWGYNLMENLPSLTMPVGDWRKVRHNYYQLLSELFIERWSKPYHDYCQKNGLEFTGHYWDHEWPNCVGVPDNMAMYAWPQRPAIDCLMNQYREDTHAQFGNIRMVKELSSVANQVGQKRTLCEVYGAGGWDLRFEDMKRIGDWLAVLGVNTMDEHLSYVTIRGARKRDHPQSFSYHEPWWGAYHVNAEYLTRLSVAVSQGQQVNRVLVIEPTSTAWMYQGDAAKLKELGDSFFKLLKDLESAQWEYDLACEDILARSGSVVDKTSLPKIEVGQRKYYHVILPSGLENVNIGTAKLLQEFVAAEGVLSYFADGLPTRVDGVAYEKLKQDILKRAALPPSTTPGSRTGKHLRQWNKEDYAQKLGTYRLVDPYCVITRDSEKGILFHQRRQVEDGQILLLVNTSITEPASGSVETIYKGIEQWNLNTGDMKPYAFEQSGQGLKAKFQLPPSGSLLLFLSQKEMEPPATVVCTTLDVPPASAMDIRRVEPNVLTLDYVDITAGGETKTNLYFYQANQFAWQKNGMARNPWDSAVQFKDELITNTFPAGSGFSATYAFTIDGKVPSDLSLVVERPDLYSVTCNGFKVAPRKGAWWLDKAFGRMDIASCARPGENLVKLHAAPFTIYHEIEPAYILGSFTLKPAASGFVITADEMLKLGKWNEQGHPFYSAGVSYAQLFGVDEASGQFKVVLPQWYGSVAKVVVNGKPAGYISAPPWECDVTKQVKKGANTIEVVAIGTLKNTLGPHHNKPGLGSAWPAMFQKGPNPGPPAGKDYDTVGYGLFETFAVKHSFMQDVAEK